MRSSDWCCIKMFEIKYIYINDAINTFINLFII